MFMSDSAEFARPARVAVVGVGNVGASFAYALLLSGLAAEIVLIAPTRAKAEGEAMALTPAIPFPHPPRVGAADSPVCGGPSVIVLAAGAGQNPGATRLDLVHNNARIWRE